MLECEYIDMQLRISEHICLRPGHKIRIGRFSDTTWDVKFGWYSYGGNREVCGWYLQSCDNKHKIRPLQKPDLTDTYMVTI